MIFSNNNIPHSFSFFVMHLYITDSKETQLKKNLPFPAFYLPSLVLLPHRKLFFGYSLQHIKHSLSFHLLFLQQCNAAYPSVPSAYQGFSVCPFSLVFPFLWSEWRKWC